jgi:hypothetical protein
MHRHQDWHASLCAASLHPGVVLACVEAFGPTLTHKTVGGIDNASMQTRDAWADRSPSWKQRGVVIKYLSPYAPE